MPEQIKRQTAYKVWISDLVNYKSTDENFSSIQIKDKNVSRVSLIANVVLKYESEDKNYYSITLDDGSAQIRVKAWGPDIRLLDKIEIGDILLLIGRLRQYNQEVYIVPEIVKKVDNPNWELVRKLELLKEYGKPSKVEVEKKKIVEETPEVVEETIVENVSETDRQKILRFVEKLDTEAGVEITILCKEASIDEQKAESLIKELLEEGELFEPSPGKVKIT
jgi:RPA family protein